MSVGVRAAPVGRLSLLAALTMGFTSFCYASSVKSYPAPCSRAGIDEARLNTDKPITIVSISSEHTSGRAPVPFCLVKLRVPDAINIWIALPMGEQWNGRLRSEGSTGYGGLISVPEESVRDGYIGVRTDTGHHYEQSELATRSGDFALIAPGVPNVASQIDFAYRSQHLMAVLGKQLARAYYGREPIYSYWTGCSEGGREGLRMAQDFPGDYHGVLVGAPAIYWDRFAASHTWPPVIMRALAKGPISPGKQALATEAALTACDALDGVVDRVISDPRRCHYSAGADPQITRAGCGLADSTCLSPAEADAIDRIWEGPTTAEGKLLWPGIEKGAPLGMIAGPVPLISAINHPRYWVYHDPNWDWHSLTRNNFEDFFRKSEQVSGPLIASASPQLAAFRERGGKILAWHGFNDPVIMPRGTIAYYESVAQASGAEYPDVQQFFRLFMAPGVEHCGGGDAPQPATAGLFHALVDWVEKGRPPAHITATQALPDGKVRARPLCPYPGSAQFSGRGNSDDAENFSCVDDARPSVTPGIGQPQG